MTIERFFDMADPEHYSVMRAAGSEHECPVETCRLSAEEHHRLAYGIIAENRELRRRLAELQGSGPKVKRAVNPLVLNALRLALADLEKEE